MDYSKYKVLYIDSKIISRNDIIWGLLELGFQVERAKTRVDLLESDDDEVELIKQELISFNFAVTQNFSLPVSKACYEMNIPYISWVYDSPQVALYHKDVCFPTNFIFAFDKKQVERIKAIGCENIYYQPLAANMLATSAINVTDDEMKKYGSDISFVGGIYNQSKYYSILEEASDNIKKNISELYKNVAGKWGKGISPLNYLCNETIQHFANYVDGSHIGKYLIEDRFLTEAIYIIPTLAGFERKEMLRHCSRLAETKLYTKTDKEQLSDLDNVIVCPPVDAANEVYKVYYSSKINLNITLRSIETGIPQRVFDIMSVGGPVLSNYQEELEELFVPGKDIILYNSFEEMEDKIKYYLSHENERIKIGINGYYRVRDEYNYKKSLTKIFEVVEKFL